MPAKRGHEISLIVTAQKVPQVPALANWTTIDGVNYTRTEAPPLVRAFDLVVLPAAFLAWGDLGMVLFIPETLAYLLIAAAGRALIRNLRARQADLVIDSEALRSHEQP